MNARATLGVVALSALCPAAAAQETRALLDAPLVVSTHYRLSALTDLDADGFQDAVGWWWSSSTRQSIYLRMYMNDQQGGFTLGGYVNLLAGNGSGPGGLVTVRACDVDHDGRGDFSVLMNRPSGSGSSSLNVFTGNGFDAPRLVPTYSYGGTTATRMDAALADLDGDGTTDLVLAVGTELRVYSYAPVPGGDPIGTLRGTLVLPAVTDDVFVIDANGDAELDAYVNMGGTGWIVPIAGFQPGTPIVVPHGIATMPMPVAGDIDGDGDQDLVVFDMPSYVVMRRTGPASWSFEPATAGGPATHLFDVDNDGDLDGVCCGGGGPTIPYNRGASTFRVSLNDGTGRFAPAFEIPGLGADHLAGAADLDHDGDLDLVAGRCAYYSRDGITRPVMPSLATANNDRAFVADLDRDGDPDFRPAVGSVRRNLGTGESESFTPVCPAPPPGITLQLPGFHGDFDGDGDVDLLTQRWAGSTHLGAWLYTNNGGGGFVDAGQAGPVGVDMGYGSPGMTPERCVLADLDADGDLDLFVWDWSLGPLTRIYKNDGQGRFFEPRVDVPGCGVQTVCDLDGDGLLDMLDIASPLNVHWGLGGGAFQAGVAVGTAGSLYLRGAVDVADLDGDGDLDIVAAAPGSNVWRPAEVFWNLGGRVFVREGLDDARIDYSPTGRAANAVDVNGDGRLDLVVGPAGGAWSAAHVVLRRADNSGWEPPIQQALYPEHSTLRAIVHHATVVDVDADGDPDLVTDRVIRNTQRQGPLYGKRLQTTDGVAGGGGMTPTLGSTGPYPVGSTTTLRLTGACAGANGMLTVGWLDSQVPVFGGGGSASHQPLGAMRITSQILFTTGGTPGVDGTGEWTLTYQVPRYKAGRTYVYRVVIDDPAAFSGQSATNRLHITYGL